MVVPNVYKNIYNTMIGMFFSCNCVFVYLYLIGIYQHPFTIIGITINLFRTATLPSIDCSTFVVVLLYVFFHHPMFVVL